MKKRTVMIQVEVETGAGLAQIQKWLKLTVRGKELMLVETPKVNVIRGTKK